jgi:hypothetical protein
MTAAIASHAKPSATLLFIFLGVAAVSLIASFSLLAAAVYIH